MADQYIGKLNIKKSEAGNTYFKGFIGNVPVVGFYGKKDPDSINLKLDVSFIKWKDEQDEDKGKVQSKGKAEDKTTETFVLDDDDLPF